MKLKDFWETTLWRSLRSREPWSGHKFRAHAAWYRWAERT